MIADSDFTVSKLYGMLPASTSGDPALRTPADNQTVRNVFVIGPDKKIKLILVYPMTTGRNFDEVLRVIDSLQLTARHKVSTPVNWRRGEDVIIAGSVSDEEAEQMYPQGWKAPDAGVGEDSVECGGEVRAAVADHELDPVRLIAEVLEEVAGLLRGPVPGWMQRDSEDADAQGGVLDHGQDVDLGAVEQVDGEEVACQDRLGLAAQELRPGWPGPPRRRVDAVGLEDLPHGRRARP